MVCYLSSFWAVFLVVGNAGEQPEFLQPRRREIFHQFNEIHVNHPANAAGEMRDRARGLGAVVECHDEVEAFHDVVARGNPVGKLGALSPSVLPRHSRPWPFRTGASVFAVICARLRHAVRSGARRCPASECRLHALQKTLQFRHGGAAAVEARVECGIDRRQSGDRGARASAISAIIVRVGLVRLRRAAGADPARTARARSTAPPSRHCSSPEAAS